MFYWLWWPTILGPMRMGYGIVECPKKLSLGGMVALYILIRTVDSILLWQLRNTLQCTESYFGIDVFLVPFASSTTLSGWNPKVDMLMVGLGWKKRRKMPSGQTQTYWWCKNCAAENWQHPLVLTCGAGALLPWVNLEMVVTINFMPHSTTTLIP